MEVIAQQWGEDILSSASAPLEPSGVVTAATGRDPRCAKVCMLILTHSCNLNCSYCYERYKSSRKMSRETALRCLQEQLQEVRESDSFDWLLVDLFGGEPLLNAEVIRYLAEWVRANVQDIDVLFTISSNGTLPKPDTELLNVKCVLSRNE